MDKNTKVLIVDDEVSIRQLTRRILEKEDFEVFEAASGDDALIMLENNESQFDVILLDIMMPGINGFEVLHRIRRNQASDTLKVIMLTAMANIEDKASAFSAGANDYLVKPIENNELVSRVKMHAEFRCTELALHESQRQFQQIEEFSPFPIFILSPDGKTEYLNPQFSKLFGYTIDDIPTAQEWFEFAFPDTEYRREVMSSWKSDENSIGNDTIELVKREFDVVCGDNSTKTVTIRTIRMDNGKFYRVFHDITEAKSMVQDLRESEERFKEMANLLPQSVFELDLAGNLTFINNYAFESTGYTHDDFESGMNAIQMFVPEDRERAVGNIAKRLEGTEFTDHEYTILRKDGTTFPALLYSSPILHDGTPIGLRGIVLNITERKQAEEELRESEEKFRVIASSANDAIIMIDNDGRISLWNHAATSIFGYTQSEAIGQKLHRFLAPERFHEDSQAGFLSFQKTGKGNAIGKTIELAAIKKNGEESPVELSMSALQLENEWHAVGIIRDITERKRTEAEISQKNEELRAAEEELREANQHLEEKVEARTAELKKVNNLLRTEISERKLAEEKIIESNYKLQVALDDLNSSQEQLLQSAKLAAVGELISGISHELKNPLAAISMAAEILDAKIDDEKSKKHVQIVSNHAQRAVSIVDNLLSFARKHESNRSYVSMNNAIHSTIELLSYELMRDNIEVVTELDSNIPNTMVDFNQMQHVFLNLIGNAGQAMHEAHGKGNLIVRTQENNETIQITIADDGPGIPEKIKERIFEPFFTTKGVGKGTGLGLSICYGIIDQHGGTIQVESKEEEGSTFTVELPVVHEKMTCTT
ncbi:MAG: PAS domain S-box protein [Chloroflexi bacterium]|nr:PAS domain S-box protein [Chloroflexota bacterium]